MHIGWEGPFKIMLGENFVNKVLKSEEKMKVFFDGSTTLNFWKKFQT